MKVTFEGSRAEILDLIFLVRRQNFNLREDAQNVPADSEPQCKLCKAGKFSSYRNYEQHLSNKHNASLDTIGPVDQENSDEQIKALAAQLQQMVNQLVGNKQ